MHAAGGDEEGLSVPSLNVAGMSYYAIIDGTEYELVGVEAETNWQALKEVFGTEERTPKAKPIKVKRGDSGQGDLWINGATCGSLVLFTTRE